MKQITININQAIYEHIMFFLKSLPNNLIDIQAEKTVTHNPNRSQIKFGLAKDRVIYYSDIMAEDKDINDMFYGS